jgi:hypothetical protein
MLLGRSEPYPRGSARTLAMVTAPPYGCGADTQGVGLRRDLTPAPVASDRGRQDPDRGTQQHLRSEGSCVS